MGTVYITFYKKKRKIDSLQTAYFRFMDGMIRLFTWSKYSHCEIAIKPKKNSTEYICYSSSVRDGGVRFKTMALNPADWDIFELPEVTEKKVKDFYEETKGMKYDFLGAVGSVLHTREIPNKYFCSEWCSAVLGLTKPYKYSPGRLYNHCKSKFK